MILGAISAYNLIHQHEIEYVLSQNVSQNFTWKEVFQTTSNEDILTAAQRVFENAVKQSVLMEQIRQFLEKPIIVHCWYRSPDHNAEVGGKPHSFHMLGLATDFNVEGMDTVQANLDVQEKLDKAPFMQRCGLEFTQGDWVHVDSRGYKARFSA